MTDREKVLAQCEWAIKQPSPTIIEAKKFYEDVLELLKEQEAELSYREDKAITHTATKLDDATCPSCGNVVGEKQIWEGRKIFIQWKYCIFCGQKLGWEGR